MTFNGSITKPLVLALAIIAQATGEETSPVKFNYDEHVRPILREHCLTCHNQSQAKGGLALDTYAKAMAGGSSGEVVVAGDPSVSRLWALVSHAEQPFMPPMQDKLPDEKLDIIRVWIEGGAPENSGSTVVVKKKKSLSLAAPSEGNKPAGEPAVPKDWPVQSHTLKRSVAVRAIATSPWAPVIAVGGFKQITLYNTDSLALLGVAPYPEGTPNSLCFSRDGSTLVIGGGRGGQSGNVVLLDVATGTRLAEIGDELDTVLASDIDRSLSKVALGGPQRIVRVYSVESGQPLYELKKHTDWIYAAEFSPDGVFLATADRSGGLFVWEADTGREYLNLRGHAGAVFDVSWRSDSNLLASAGEDGTIRIWELNDGAQVKGWGAHGGGAFSVKYLADGNLISSGRNRVATLWNADGAAIRSFASPEESLRAANSFDGKRVFIGDLSGAVTVSSLADGVNQGALSPNP